MSFPIKNIKYSDHLMVGHVSENIYFKIYSRAQRHSSGGWK